MPAKVAVAHQTAALNSPEWNLRCSHCAAIETNFTYTSAGRIFNLFIFLKSAHIKEINTRKKPNVRASGHANR